MVLIFKKLFWNIRFLHIHLKCFVKSCIQTRFCTFKYNICGIIFKTDVFFCHALIFFTGAGVWIFCSMREKLLDGVWRKRNISCYAWISEHFPSFEEKQYTMLLLNLQCLSWVFSQLIFISSIHQNFNESAAYLLLQCFVRKVIPHDLQYCISNIQC